MPAYKSLWGGGAGRFGGEREGLSPESPLPLPSKSSLPSRLYIPAPSHQLREAAGDFKVGGMSLMCEKGQGFRARVGDMGAQLFGD